MQARFIKSIVCGCVMVLCVDWSGAAEEGTERSGLFSKQNLVAWCIVPFDASKRGPAERAEMLARLGIPACAYDWREAHIPQFEDEILQYREHGIRFHAFWCSGLGANKGNEEMFQLFAKYDLHPDLWVVAPNRKEWSTDKDRIAGVIEALSPLVQRAREMKCRIALYNHGGWTGEPENLAALVTTMRQKFRTEDIGISYVFHHAHDHMARFPGAFKAIAPYLFCVSLNGMRLPDAPDWEKIISIGEGSEDLVVLRMIRDSGYRGPIGILDHRPEMDAEKSLRENLEGLAGLRNGLGSETR